MCELGSDSVQSPSTFFEKDFGKPSRDLTLLLNLEIGWNLEMREKAEHLGLKHVDGKDTTCMVNKRTVWAGVGCAKRGGAMEKEG